jgi:hypothetical protein
MGGVCLWLPSLVDEDVLSTSSGPSQKLRSCKKDSNIAFGVRFVDTEEEPSPPVAETRRMFRMNSVSELWTSSFHIVERRIEQECGLRVWRGLLGEGGTQPSVNASIGESNEMRSSVVKEKGLTRVVVLVCLYFRTWRSPFRNSTRRCGDFAGGGVGVEFVYTFISCGRLFILMQNIQKWISSI